MSAVINLIWAPVRLVLLVLTFCNRLWAFLLMGACAMDVHMEGLGIASILLLLIAACLVVSRDWLLTHRRLR